MAESAHAIEESGDLRSEEERNGERGRDDHLDHEAAGAGVKVGDGHQSVSPVFVDVADSRRSLIMCNESDGLLRRGYLDHLERPLWRTDPAAVLVAWRLGPEICVKNGCQQIDRMGV